MKTHKATWDSSRIQFNMIIQKNLIEQLIWCICLDAQNQCKLVSKQLSEFTIDTQQIKNYKQMTTQCKLEANNNKKTLLFPGYLKFVQASHIAKCR